MLKLRPTLMVALVALFVVGVARAELVSVAITGEVTYVDDRGGLLDSRIDVGDELSGFYRYDSATADSDPLANVGLYEYHTSPFGVSLHIGEMLFAGDPQNVDFSLTLYNDYGSKDRYLLTSANNLPLPDGTLVAQIWWQLEDSTATALTSDALITSAPEVWNWQGNNLRITCGSDGATRIGATVTDAWLLPEPATALLLSLGAITFLRRKRQ